MRDSTETHSLTTYSDCHEYHAESTVRFDEPSLVEPAGKGSGVPGAPLPAGLKIRLAIETPIDTNIAAAGDVFTAKVLKPVRAGHSKETTIPAGAIVRGRIVGMDHFIRRVSKSMVRNRRSSRCWIAAWNSRVPEKLLG